MDRKTRHHGRKKIELDKENRENMRKIIKIAVWVGMRIM